MKTQNEMTAPLNEGRGARAPFARVARSAPTRGRLSTLLAGWALLGSTACGAAADSGFGSGEGEREYGEVAQDITGGWTLLTLNPGWSNYWGTANPPAVGVVDGIVTFRGALKATKSAGASPFQLPEAVRPVGDAKSNIELRISHSGGVGGTLFISAQNDENGETYDVFVNQDGVEGLGSAARILTSLDGAAFDQVAGEQLAWDDTYWANQYPWRVGGNPPLAGGPFVKNVDGFVRFQGYMEAPGQSELPGYVFTLPSEYRTSQTVMIPINLEDSWGQLTIFSTGDAYVHGNPPAAALGTSFEGAFYSRTTQGNAGLSMQNGWVSGSRAARVGIYDGVVRFQGSVKNGTTNTIATLPSNMRPPQTVYLVAAAANGPVPARIYVQTNGQVRVDTSNLPLWVAAQGVSLDGVSFAL